jgi:hypothetical protein
VKRVADVDETQKSRREKCAEGAARARLFSRSENARRAKIQSIEARLA